LSYDLTLLYVPDGMDAELAYQEQVAQQEQELVTADLDGWLKRPVSEPSRAQMRRLADAIKSWRSTLAEFQPKSPLPWIELNDDDLQIKFEVYERTVAITMPYFRERAREMMECATGSFAVLQVAAGYIAYDPQLGRTVTAADLSEMLAQYRRADGAPPGMLTGDSQSPPAIKKPWWKVW
jgi:hypothetical protein